MIPVYDVNFGPEELRELEVLLHSGWISSKAPAVSLFEEKCAALCDREYAVAVSSGTAALQLAVEALNLRKGSEIILPAFTMISTAAAVVRAGHVPVLVDVTPDTWTMDVSQIEGKITGRTMALMPVHIYGHPVDMQGVNDIAEDYGLSVIEDAAEAQGARYEVHPGVWQAVGSMGRAACFSFYANKIVTTGEGGMVVTDDRGFADRVRDLSNLCFGAQEQFRHEELGWNYKMSGLQAAVGLAQLRKLEGILFKKKWIAETYQMCLGGVPGIRFQLEAHWGDSAHWMVAVLFDRIEARTASALLRAKGVETRPLFVGMHHQPAFAKMDLFWGENYPVTEKLSREGLYLPSGLTLTEAQIKEVCSKVREVACPA